jgi:hypothetical protein
MTRASRSSGSAATRAARWACSARTPTSSCCATTVCARRLPCVRRTAYRRRAEFGLYVDRHGNPSRTMAVVEWEGTAERAAHHPPYVLLFDSRFIEVRNAETGRLAQIIPGEHVRCTWDGRAASRSMPDSNDVEAEGLNLKTSVHMVRSMSGRPGVRPQQIIELIPTIPRSSVANAKASSIP